MVSGASTSLFFDGVSVSGDEVEIEAGVGDGKQILQIEFIDERI